MKISIRFRHRAVSSERVSSRHSGVVERLTPVFESWLGDVKIDAVYAELEAGAGGGAVDLTPALCGGVQGAVSYSSRRGLGSDQAMYDDLLQLDFERESPECGKFSSSIFMDFVGAFDAYRAASFTNEDLDLDDYDEIIELAEVTGKDVDGRDGVFRVWPFNYCDEELCRRAFSKSPDQMAFDLNGQVEQVEVLEGGILIVSASLSTIDRDRLETLDRHVKAVLR